MTVCVTARGTVEGPGVSGQAGREASGLLSGWRCACVCWWHVCVVSIFGQMQNPDNPRPVKGRPAGSDVQAPLSLALMTSHLFNFSLL